MVRRYKEDFHSERFLLAEAQNASDSAREEKYLFFPVFPALLAPAAEAKLQNFEAAKHKEKKKNNFVERDTMTRPISAAKPFYDIGRQEHDRSLG